MWLRSFFSLISLVICSFAFGQEADPKPVLVVDDIQIDVKAVSLSAKADTAIVELFLVSYKKNPREFKLNTFSTGVVASEGGLHLYSSMQMGRILVNLSDRKNYIHYLLTQDVPVLLKIKTANWKAQWGKPQQVKLTFEDSAEEGKFLEVLVDL